MILHLLRLGFILTVMMLATAYGIQEDVTSKGSRFTALYLAIPGLAAFAIVIADMFWKRKPLQLLSGLFFGFLTGLLIMWAFNYIFDLAFDVYPRLKVDPTLKLIQASLSVCIVFFCVTVVMQTKDDFRFIIPYVEFSKHTKGTQAMLLDTSVIIDGRIADIIDTKILQNELIVPRFVLTELQTIADSADKLKRNRGRRGLEILQKIQQNPNADIKISDQQTLGTEKAKDVDAKLVALAEHIDAKIMTNDYNLNKIAQLRGIEIFNINDLANAMKPMVLPGEKMSVKIIRPGEEHNQGVAYLDDGTMIVVDQARNFVGQSVKMTVTSSLQTSAGRMIFGKIDHQKQPQQSQNNSKA